MSDSNRFSFSKALLNKLPNPEAGKRAYYYDTKTHGLGLSITPKGTKTFILYRKIHGKPERITLGRYPNIEIDEARALAHEANAAIERGENPNAKKRLARAEWTIGELFELYLEQYAKLHKRSWEEDEAQYQRYLQIWVNRKLSSLRKTDIQMLHTEIGQNHGQFAANRLLSLLQTMFNKAIEWGWEKPNPALGIKKFTERSRERFLQADELPRFFQALATESNTTIRDYVWLSLLTGARKSNVLSMRRQDLDLKQGLWTIPMTKNGTSQLLPLVPEAVEILQRRLQADNTHTFIFPSHSQTGHLVEPKKAWKKLLERAGIEDLRLHDLRRSMGSWQATTGANLSVIGKTLNHKDVSSTSIYARLSLDPVRQAMETATRAMLDAGQRGFQHDDEEN